LIIQIERMRIGFHLISVAGLICSASAITDESVALSSEIESKLS